MIDFSSSICACWALMASILSCTPLGQSKDWRLLISAPDWRSLMSTMRQRRLRLRTSARRLAATFVSPVGGLAVITWIIWRRCETRERGGSTSFLNGYAAYDALPADFKKRISGKTIKQGNIVDTLMPPLSTTELLLGYVAGGMARGIKNRSGLSAERTLT